MDQSSDKRGKPLTFLKPYGDHLYIYMDIREQLSSIIITTENRHQISETGVIIAKGDDVNPQFKIGDRVLISYYTGVHIQIPESYTSSQFHRIIREHEVLSIIDQEKRDNYKKE